MLDQHLKAKHEKPGDIFSYLFYMALRKIGRTRTWHRLCQGTFKGAWQGAVHGDADQRREWAREGLSIGSVQISHYAFLGVGGPPHPPCLTSF